MQELVGETDFVIRKQNRITAPIFHIDPPMRCISDTVYDGNPSTSRLLFDELYRLFDIGEMAKEIGCSCESHEAGPVGEQRKQVGCLESQGEGRIGEWSRKPVFDRETKSRS